MTTADYPSLDELFKTTPPVEPAPFDLAVILRQHRYAVGEIPNAAQWAITRYVNGLRVDTEKARAWARALENENAELTDTIVRVVTLLTDALTWHSSETDNTACAVQDALGLLTDALALALLTEGDES